ncbi:MAG: redox-regulated ATPase YchF [Armatimonadota bacterium]|nr:redox-regulated ATPase YchF [bacterium]
MRVGIVGLPSSGKTTLFKALTRGTVKVEESYGQGGKPNIGVVSVPDSRVDYFVNEYHPKKITYASIEFIDGAAKIATDHGRTKFGSDFFADVRQVDALVHVVRGYTGSGGEAPTPVHDLQTLQDELMLADLQLVENRIPRVEKQLHGVKKGAATPANVEMELLERIKTTLEEGNSLKTIEFASDEEKIIRGYDFLTLKRMIAVLNISESELGSQSEQTITFHKACEESGIPAIELCAEIEMEVSQLADEEEAEFLQSMGVEEPARNVLIRACYEALGLISFLTAGEPEVRAWTIHAGEKAVDAAGTIHSDLARGFIRAEVANFKDVEAAGGWDAAKQKGIIQLQGKDYVVQDGDVMYIRFKV